MLRRLRAMASSLVAVMGAALVGAMVAASVVSVIAHEARAADRVMLASVGETIGGLPVVEVVEHDEYEWVKLELPDGEVLTVELTRTHPGNPGLCSSHGHSLMPRWELLDREVSVEDQPPAVVALCARLEARGETLDQANLQGSSPDARAGEVHTRQRVAPTERPRPFHWLHGVLLALAVACGIALLGPGRRAWGKLGWGERAELGLVAAVAVGARQWLSPRAVLWGPNFGVGRLVEAWGLTPDHPLYGGGFSALMALPSAIFGWGPDTVFSTHLAVAALAPPLLWALVRAAMPPARARAAALIAGLALALLPLHLKMAGTEIEHIDVLTLELLALLCAEGFCQTRSGALALASALATGFVAHIRPEVVAFSVVPAAWVLARGRTLHKVWFGVAAAIISVLVAQRIGALLMGQGPTSNALQLGVFAEPSFWSRVVLPQFGVPGANSTTHTFMHMRLTPLVLPIFAVAGFIHASARLRGLAALWWLCTTLFILPKAWPLADAFRLQLPGHAPLLMMAGMGGAAFATWFGSITHRRFGPWGAVGLVAITSLPHLVQVPTLLAPQEEFQFLREVGPEIPPDATVLLDDWGPHYGDLTHWMSTAPPCGDQPCAQWTGMGPFLDRLPDSERPLDATPNVYAWLGVTCAYRPPLTGSGSDGIAPSSCDRLAARCELEAVQVTTVSSRTDVDVRLPEPSTTVGLYRVSSCGRSDDEAPPE
jgi:hypothetical protein